MKYMLTAKLIFSMFHLSGFFSKEIKNLFFTEEALITWRRAGLVNGLAHQVT